MLSLQFVGLLILMFILCTNTGSMYINVLWALADRHFYACKVLSLKFSFRKLQICSMWCIEVCKYRFLIYVSSGTMVHYSLFRPWCSLYYTLKNSTSSQSLIHNINIQRRSENWDCFLYSSNCKPWPEEKGERLFSFYLYYLL